MILRPFDAEGRDSPIPAPVVALVRPGCVRGAQRAQDAASRDAGGEAVAAERSGKIDISRLTAVLTELYSPWPVQPGMHAEDRTSPSRPVPARPRPRPDHITMWKARRQTIGLLDARR
ncbi:hypothetical protein [Streptomyces sp. B3I8]|uniref:hypothetical protein n=1 Tax=Streptomyces sp. B3I8 TaxID=3042303 RepID=UPI002785696D|nr:hypothetical protein [Streptomyces sp. B3I8]MDQ0784894.1 hypothetical protein [Streptomyces sp. B3I8]